jgi:alanyl-tRNA synthetase
MRLNEVRARYLAFFEKRGHAVLPTAPIVPGNDPTTLFTSSGMQPLLPYFLGQTHPKGTRVVNSQLSFRANDIEEVGDNRHTTFFEMLGNWSFGDYFKKEQLPWVYQFLTDKEEGLGLDVSRLYVSVYAGDKEAQMQADDEAVEIWKEIFAKEGIEAQFANIGSEADGYERGMKEGEKIFAYDSKKNWWSRSGVPANMPTGEPGGPDSELFYDFGTPHDTKFGEHCHINCDCGRFIEIGNSVFMQYMKNADGSFSQLPKLNVDFGGGLERLTAATILSNDVFLIDAFAGAKEVMEKDTGVHYGTDSAVTKSMRIVLDHMRAATFILAEQVRPSNTEAGYILRRLLRKTIRELDELGSQSTTLQSVARSYIEYFGEAYPHLTAFSSFVYEELAKEESKFKETLAQGLKEYHKAKAKGQIDASTVFTLYTTYGFPVELTYDMLAADSLTVSKEEVGKLMTAHQEDSRKGASQKFTGGLADTSEQTVAYHTTHHILLGALQKVLGKDVHQRGSNITSERLRIDFSYGQKMTPEQLKEVEEIVNTTIKANLPVTKSTMSLVDAQKLGAEMEFGVKYPDVVTVYSVGPKDATEQNPLLDQAFSLEFCGGPHVSNTHDIHQDSKSFKILKEEASSAGVRRIKAVVQ